MRWRKIKQNPKAAQSSADSKPKLDLKESLPHELTQDINAKFYYATFFERGKAQVIDTFMLYIPILYFLTYVVVGSAQGFRDSSWAPFIGVFVYGVFVALFMAFKGQTPGKKAYDLWIVRQNGKKVTFLFAFFRFFGFLLSGFTVVGVLLPLWRKDRKALHDILFKTLVARRDRILV